MISFSSKKLTPEQQKAINVFTYYTNNNNNAKQTYDILDLSLNNIVIENTQFFICGKITKQSLPHENHWSWTQTNQKLLFKLSNNTNSIILRKFNARRNKKQTNPLEKNNIPCPSYKVWVFEILGQIKPLYFIWCERGKKTIYSKPPTVRAYTRNKDKNTKKTESPTLNIKDYAFLKDFIDKDLAIQFGWI